MPIAYTNVVYLLDYVFISRFTEILFFLRISGDVVAVFMHIYISVSPLSVRLFVVLFFFISIRPPTPMFIGLCVYTMYLYVFDL